LADDAVIKQVKEANDIVAVVGGYVALRPAGGTFKGLCPFHNDSRPSFDVDPRRQRFRCWSCGKYGDVISFVQEFDRVDFREALELLARRAGISLENESASPQARGRALMLDTVRWAAERYHRCLLESPLAETARKYVGERGITGETVRRFGLGFAPPSGDWLIREATQAKIDFDLLEKVGLIAKSQEGNGYYSRFRDRVMFPIRERRGQAVGFGGRILPSSPLAERAPKYYNSAETALFRKSECLYGLDLARQPGTAAGYLAVVEGYTDVLMAHQLGIPQVVAPMGTALNERHVQQLRAFVPRVVLVFDADAGGDTGADRALRIFASQNVDLAVATLPEGMDPCDLLVQRGPEPFLSALTHAVDALEFKLNQVLEREGAGGVEGRRRAVDAILTVLALAPDMPDQDGAIKRDLIISRIAQRLALQEENLRHRLRELSNRRRDDERPQAPRVKETAEAETKRFPPAPEELQLLRLLLADPSLIPDAAAEVTLDMLQHPRVRQVIGEMYALHSAGESCSVDQLRVRIDDAHLTEIMLNQHDIGRKITDRPVRLRELLAVFREKHHIEPRTREIKNQLHAAGDHDKAVELLRQLQNQRVGLEP
jgi:DNA primase